MLEEDVMDQVILDACLQANNQWLMVKMMHAQKLISTSDAMEEVARIHNILVAFFRENRLGSYKSLVIEKMELLMDDMMAYNHRLERSASRNQMQ